MKLQEFLNYLTNISEKELVFQLGETEIRKDYHITEVLTTSVAAIDCGGKLDNWNETILQLIEPGHIEGARFMSKDKALSILEKSFTIIDFKSDSNLVLEFRPENSPSAQRYNLESIYTEGNKVIVKTAGATTQCKAATRVDSTGINECCSPAGKEKKGKVSCCG